MFNILFIQLVQREITQNIVTNLCHIIFKMITIVESPVMQKYLPVSSNILKPILYLQVTYLYYRLNIQLISNYLTINLFYIYISTHIVSQDV